MYLLQSRKKKIINWEDREKELNDLLANMKKRWILGCVVPCMRKIGACGVF